MSSDGYKHALTNMCPHTYKHVHTQVNVIHSKPKWTTLEESYPMLTSATHMHVYEHEYVNIHQPE